MTWDVASKGQLCLALWIPRCVSYSLASKNFDDDASSVDIQLWVICMTARVSGRLFEAALLRMWAHKNPKFHQVVVEVDVS